jgi:formylglycine-generating enzyme required for sulfatase activity
MAERLAEAYQKYPHDRELSALLDTIAKTGFLIVDVDPPTAEIRVTERPEEAKAILLALPAGCPAAARHDAVYSSGERIELSLGHYWVTLAGGGRTCGFPLFIGQIVLEKGAGGWREGKTPILSHQVRPWSEASQVEAGAARFTVAEEQRIAMLLPRKIPADSAYVPPGISWTSRQPGFVGAVELKAEDATWKPPLGLEQHTLVRCVLEHGFFIGKDEVSIGEFKEWLARFGDAFFAWRGEDWARTLIAETSCLTLAELRESWGRDAGLMGMDGFGPAELAACTTREELCRARARAEGQDAWRYKEKLAQALAMDDDERLPVGQVNFEIALAYARTFAGIDGDDALDELGRWLDLERAKVEGLIAGVLRLEEALGRTDGALLRVSDIPEDIRLPENERGLYDFREETLVENYLNWLKGRVRFSRMLPVDAMLDWAQGGSGPLNAALAKRLPELGKRLEDPLQELWHGPWGGREDGKEDECMHLVWEYVKHIETAAAPPAIDRVNFIAWLASRRAILQGRQDRLEELLRHTRATVGAAMPWDLRLEFGRWQGWDLPTSDQWEKACRGPDSRHFPWGNESREKEASLGPDRSGPRLRERNRQGVDVSPYDVWGMAGNVSEFILQPPFIEGQEYSILKGGNFKHAPIYANAGSMLGLWGLDRGRFAGFRVVRELHPGGPTSVARR